ncbi:RHS repeat domain-containing protein [Paludibacterium denitrificans]|uniref:RHS repeat-associated core domain-containing protein n=1 Tax=Paludibacterium denitrificans TaxID=2675226 RepID=A0A844GDK4_9NEIS|nr:hypothetical protein [Paludibacterium denitrificans]
MPRRQPPCGIRNPFRFRGQYHDDESGLHYNRYRYYDPEIGRFRLCCTNQSQVELPQSPDGLIPCGPFAVCPRL